VKPQAAGAVSRTRIRAAVTADTKPDAKKPAKWGAWRGDKVAAEARTGDGLDNKSSLAHEPRTRCDSQHTTAMQPADPGS
jgi:hypothetical protein